VRNSSGAGWTLREKASLCADVGVGLANTATDSSAKSLNFTNTIQEEQANAYQSVKNYWIGTFLQPRFLGFSGRKSSGYQEFLILSASNACL
jgi:hypothetical protein